MSFALPPAGSYYHIIHKQAEMAKNLPEIHFFWSSIMLLSTMTSSKVSLSMKK